MKVKLSQVLFEFHPICVKCGENQNEDGTYSTLQCNILDIDSSGYPCCTECGEWLSIENECEVKL